MNDANHLPIVDVYQLSYEYSGGVPALRNTTFRIQAGESVGLVGPNGAGKTTLFLCLSGILPGQRGTVRVAGLDPSNPKERRQLPAHVGIVFQNSDDQLFHPSVVEDVAFGPLNLGLNNHEARERVAEALRQVGMEGYEGRVPQHLSGGEKRRVALAGVLAMRPGILLLDEPTMFLDPRGRRDLIALLKSLPGTKIIASHDLEMVRQLCQRVVLLDAGIQVADGATSEILANAELMDAHGLEVPYGLRSQHQGS